MTAQVQIDVDAIGRGRLAIDGEELGDRVLGFDLRARVGQLTTLTLILNNMHARVDGEARELNDATLRARVRGVVEVWRDAASDEHPLEGVALRIVKDIERELQA